MNRARYTVYNVSDYGVSGCQIRFPYDVSSAKPGGYQRSAEKAHLTSITRHIDSLLGKCAQIRTCSQLACCSVTFVVWAAARGLCIVHFEAIMWKRDKCLRRPNCRRRGDTFCPPRTCSHEFIIWYNCCVGQDQK